jgi:hypothetical protein
MSGVTGPISTLPGSSHTADGMCDNHPRRKAKHRIQGETDSFGCEMHDLCDECAAEMRASMRSAEARTGECDWCGLEATDLRARRDWEEGMSGPVYRVCGPCIKRRNDEDREDDEYER